jgi:hypothetical protein
MAFKINFIRVYHLIKKIKRIIFINNNKFNRKNKNLIKILKIKMMMKKIIIIMMMKKKKKMMMRLMKKNI